MKKLVLVLVGGLLFGSCSVEVEDTRTGAENGTEEAAQGKDVIDVADIVSAATKNDINPGDVVTIEGWYLGFLGSMDSDQKTLYLGEKGSNNGPVEAIVASSDESKLEDAGFSNQVTIKGEFVELAGFGTKIKLKDCKVIEVK